MDQARGDVGGDAVGDVEDVAGGEVERCGPSEVTTSSSAVASRPAGPTRRTSRIDVPDSGYSTAGGSTGSASGVGSSDGEQVVDVDRLHREPAAHDVVAGAHQLDAGAAEVGVEVARPEPDAPRRAPAGRG